MITRHFKINHYKFQNQTSATIPDRNWKLDDKIKLKKIS